MKNTEEAVTARMPVEIAEFLAETDDLLPEEFSVYVRLLFSCWHRGGILPCDPERLARLARVDRAGLERVWPVVGKFFTARGEYLTREPLVSQLQDARDVRDSLSRKGRTAGLRSGEVRRGGRQRSLPGLEPQVEPDVQHGVEPGGEHGANMAGTSPARAEKISLRKSGSGSGSPSLRSGPFSHSGLISLFSALWRGTYFEEYQPTPADRAQLGRALREFPDTTAIEAFPWREVWERYFEDDDKFVAGKMRHSLAYFLTSGGLNKYRARDRTLGFSQREIDSAAATREWANGRSR